MQVLLVTGGYTFGEFIEYELSRNAYSLRPIKSTEILILGTSRSSPGFWTQVDPLPSARYGLKAAVLDNEIFVFGGLGYGEEIGPRGNSEIYINNTKLQSLKDILVWRTLSWEKVGDMMEARYSHAVGMLADVSEICP